MFRIYQHVFTLLIVALPFLISVGCGSPEQDVHIQIEIARIDSVRSDIANRLAEKETDANIWNEGSMLALLAGCGTEVLRTTDALLEQKAEALRAGAEFHFISNIHQVDQDKIAQIDRVILEKREELGAARARVEMYSGGLLEAIALSEVAMLQLTTTMLDQQKLALVYGLPEIPAMESFDTTDTVLDEILSSSEPIQAAPRVLQHTLPSSPTHHPTYPAHK